MSDNQTYYYMRLKENFFDSDELIVLESMENGYVYSNILLKMYLRSLKRNGRLMLNDAIPYNSEILAKVTRHDKYMVEAALKLFENLGLIEILDSGSMYMLHIQNYIGKSSTEADRQREYQRKIDTEKSNKKSNKKSTPEIEIEKEIEKEKIQCINYQQIADMYNDTCVSFPRLTKLSDARKKAIKARFNTYSLEDFQKLFEMAEGSSFLKGQNSRNWSANFDWMMKDANFAKILDGNYQDRNNTAGEEKENKYKNWVSPYKEALKDYKTRLDDPFQ